MEKLIGKLIRQAKMPWDGQMSEVAVEIATSLQPFFQKLFEQEDVNIQLPADFMVAMQWLGDRTINFGGDYGTYIWGWNSVVSNTKFWAENDYYPPDSKKEAWICIGEYSDKHWYFLCCDPNSKSYGEVVDGHDNTPWNDYESLWTEADSYQHFLELSLSDEPD